MMAAHTLRRLEAAGFHLTIEEGRLIVESETPLSEAQRAFLIANKDAIKNQLYFVSKQRRQALDILRELYHEHQQRLMDGGHDGKGALVHRDDYWRALRKAKVSTDIVFDLLDEGQLLMQAEGLYWKPMVEPA